MRSYGFFRVRAHVPEVKLADVSFNASKIIEAVKEAHKDSIDCLVLPELSLTGYTCGDLFDQQVLIKKAEEEIGNILLATRDCGVFFAVGAPVVALGKLFNCAILISHGAIWGIVPKSYLPNYNEFYEKRWFESGKNLKCLNFEYAGFYVPIGTDLLFDYKGVKIGVEICEDLWVPEPPSGKLAMAGGEVMLNLSASDDLIGKHDYIMALVSQQSARCRCVYVYSSAGWGESSTDLVFTGKALIGEDGIVVGAETRFKTHPFSTTRDVDIEKLRLDRRKFNTFTEKESYEASYRVIRLGMRVPPNEEGDSTDLNIDYKINPYPFVPCDAKELDRRCEEILDLQSYGLMKRLHSIGCRKAVVGISGGLDSTLALLVTVRAFDRLGLSRGGIIGITMPGLATTSRTKSNATSLMEKLGVTALEIPIGDAVALHFRDIGQDPQKFDATYENSQARERTQILMDMANKEGGIVIGTGDMSELALGWCTYNGDQMSMYGVNASVPKTLVRHLVEWVATKETDPEIRRILLDISDTPISPELVPASKDEIGQKTEDLVGPYVLHDFFLYHFLRNSFEPLKIYALAKNAFHGQYDPAIILKWLKVFIKRFFSQQFKRSCMPDGPKVGSVNLSPRGDWRMPSDASANLWLDQLNSLENE